jgi:uncharacterized RDD family membrane protein YckC
MGENVPKQFQLTEDLYASHSQRFLNLVIDTFILLVLFFLSLVFLIAIMELNGNKNFPNYFVKNQIAQYTFVSCISLFYYNFFEILLARTIGKLITQTMVVTINGERPGHEIILIRSICRLIPFNAISFLGITPRGWHDSISKTYVVRAKLLEERMQASQSLKNRTGES